MTGGSSRRRWSPRRSAAVRLAVVVPAYVAWSVVLVRQALATSSVTGTASSTGVPPHPVTVVGPSFVDANPGAAEVLLGLLVVGLVVGTASVVWRTVRGVTGVGATAMVAAGVTGAAAVLGLLTVGIVILPFAVLLVVLAVPLGTTGPSGGRSGPPPAWYADPAGAGTLRYWDGAGWTGWVAPPAVPPECGRPGR